MANPTSTPVAALPLALPFRFVGRPVALRIATANVDTEIRHQVPDVPHGFLVLSARGRITRAPLLTWSKDLAYIRTDVANDDVLLAFVVLKEDPLDVTP